MGTRTAVTIAAALAALAVAGTAPGAPGAAPAAGAGTVGQVSVIQAVPGATVDVAVDGRDVGSDLPAGQVLGPLDLGPGEHRIDFTGTDGLQQAASVRVAAGSTQDVVLHLPASVGGPAEVTSYRTPTKAIAPGKARVLVAHTATVAPADVRVDGAVVFTNIANGEYAVADVPAGSHVVALLPTGRSGPAILGPLTVDLPAGTVSMVYALGDPADASMELVAHAVRLTPDGSVVPTVVSTGSAGLVGGLAVRELAGPHR